MKRRDVLRGAATVGVLGTVAGCVGEGPAEEAPGGGDDGNADDGSDDGSAEPRVADSRIETVGTGCRGSDSAAEIDVAVADGGVSVTGTYDANNPCHEAVLTQADLEGTDSLAIEIALEAADVDACQDCLGAIEYEATVDLDGGVPGSITARHADGSAETTVEPDRD